jgi:hypothetical protein
MAGKNVSLSKVLAELKAVIEELEKEDPAWSDQEKKKAKHTAKVLRSVRDIAESPCTDTSQMVPGA